MQVQIKKQLKIELDQADIVEAVGNHLKANGINVSAADLEKINFVKSPKDGLRAELNIVEETGEPEVETSKPEPEPEAVVDEAATALSEDEAPGEVPSATVSDVAPAVDEAVERALTPAVEADEEEEGEVAASTADPRSRLFH